MLLVVYTPPLSYSGQNFGCCLWSTSMMLWSAEREEVWLTL